MAAAVIDVIPCGLIIPRDCCTLSCPSIESMDRMKLLPTAESVKHTERMTSGAQRHPTKKEKKMQLTTDGIHAKRRIEIKIKHKSDPRYERGGNFSSSIPFTSTSV